MVNTDAGVPTSTKRRLALIDDDAAFRAIMRSIAMRLPQMELCGESENAELGLELIRLTKPEVVVVDWLMPGMSGLDLIRKVREMDCRLRILLCTAHPHPRLAEDLFGLGVHGYLDKQSGLGTIESALRTVLGGGLFFASEVGPTPPESAIGGGATARSALPAGLAKKPANVLSPREREVAGLVASGLMSKEIATRLGIGVRTVESHRAHIMTKLGLADIPTLTRWCERVGLLDLAVGETDRAC